MAGSILPDGREKVGAAGFLVTLELTEHGRSEYSR
jgi:hypothetical protein